MLKRSDGLLAWQKFGLQVVVTGIFVFYILNYTNIDLAMRIPFWPDHYLNLDYSLPAEEFQSLVRGSKVDYIISATPELDEYLSGTTMYVLGQTENYRVWKVV